MVQEIEDHCPICHNALPKSTDSSRAAGEAHIASCLESHFPKSPRRKTSSANAPPVLESVVPKGDKCPFCHVSLISKEFDGSEEARQAHIFTCVELCASSSPESINHQPPAVDKPKPLEYSKAKQRPSKASTASMGDSKPPQATSTTLAIVEEKLEETIRQKEDGEVSTLRRWFSKLGGDSKTTPQKKALIMAKADSLMYKRWGSPGSPTYELVMKYWLSTRMQKHWLFLHGQHPRQFRRNLERGYMEPIPVSWIQSRHLARPLPESSPYETEAQKRLYYLLNNSTLPDGSRHPTLLPLHSTRNRITIINRGNERIASQVPIDPHKLASYKSPRDVFHSDPQIKSHAYSPQVPTSVSAARTQALQELADGIRAGTDRLETMLLLDVSDSMTQNPHAGIRGPDGVTRFHDQPSHIVLVKNLVHRCLHHMVPCAQKQTPSQTSIETLALNSTATLIFPLSPTTFAHDWPAKVLPDGGTQTQLIPSFHTLKTTFHSQHRNTTTLIPPFGPQPTPSTPKLSLLIFLAGEAADMDEFELELLGEPWVYVTIVLVGMENCPFHHRRAGEWERVARFNPRVGVFEVSGRVCERWVVEEVIGSVFPVGAPGREEVLRGGFDLGGEEVGGDVRFE